MEEFWNSAWRGLRTLEERDPPPPLEERRRQPEGRSLILLPLNLGSSVGESESVKERVNEPIFESWWPEFLSVSFSTLTTAEEPKSLKCIWNKTCIYFPLNISGCKTQTIQRPCELSLLYIFLVVRLPGKLASWPIKCLSSAQVPTPVQSIKDSYLLYLPYTEWIMNTQTDKVEGRHKHIKEMKHNNRKKNRTHRSFDIMRLLFDLWGLDKKISPGTHLNSTLSLFYKEP